MDINSEFEKLMKEMNSNSSHTNDPKKDIEDVLNNGLRVMEAGKVLFTIARYFAEINSQNAPEVTSKIVETLIQYGDQRVEEDRKNRSFGA